MINRLDDIDVNCTCEMPTLIVHKGISRACRGYNMLSQNSVIAICRFTGIKADAQLW